MKYCLILLAFLTAAAAQTFAQDPQPKPQQQPQPQQQPSQQRSKPEEEIRQQIAEAVTALQVPPEQLHMVTNRTIIPDKDSLNIRIYQPQATGKFPVVYYIHGGIWIAGDLNTHDNICRALSKHLNAVVVAVHYRRPPEHQFPTAFNDSYAVFKWVAAHQQELNGNGQFFVMGDSAGGQLVASLCQANLSEKNKVPITAQVLINPATDLRTSSPSYRQYGDIIDWYLAPGDNKNDFRASPLVGENISGLPPAIIIVGEHDEIRSEGEAYHQRLQSRNISSSLFVHPSAGHLGPFWCAAHEAAMPALAFIVNTIQEKFSGQ